MTPVESGSARASRPVRDARLLGSPPPCGAATGEDTRAEGLGVGVPRIATALVDPPPRPSPARGEGAVRPPARTKEDLELWFAATCAAQRRAMSRALAARC